MPVAVIDIGSNSIKLLVAARGRDGSLIELARATEETRIGAGITASPPRLRESAMESAIASIKALMCRAAPFGPERIAAVATSAVRDAENGEEFASRLFDATTLELAILGGPEEARLIGRGIGCDPALRDTAAFYLFDLGGGSLEMLAFEDARVVALRSLQLGCVRVTERCVLAPAEPLNEAVISGVQAYTREVIAQSGFLFELPPDSIAVVTGGTVTTFRAMQAQAQGLSLEEANPEIEVAAFGALAARVCAMPLAARQKIPGLPAARADVFPAALLTLVELAAAAGIARYRHSFFNLRYGLARELLDAAQ
ncbi:MAG: Ppx/GppA phosphatase family protein [Opitutaceae bacterium]